MKPQRFLGISTSMSSEDVGEISGQPWSSGCSELDRCHGGRLPSKPGGPLDSLWLLLTCLPHGAQCGEW